MDRTFRVNSTQDPVALVARARRAAVESGGRFAGDETSGRFSGSGIEGVYRMAAGGVVTVTVTRKPFLVPWPAVESGLRRFLT